MIGAKVYVAVSGGVDSSVALALLKEKGYKVTAVFMKLWVDSAEVQKKHLNAAFEASKICEVLKVPFLIWDFSLPFKEKIVDEFVSLYHQGMTPNPCILCNSHIKFGLFLEKALSLGADFIATGHYAILKKKKNYVALYRAKDLLKDQSYFLADLDQNQLSKTLLPLGEYRKEKVKSIAQKLGLISATKPESQEICFIGKAGLLDFLKKRLKSDEGLILEWPTEKVLGRHQGLFYYTIGQKLPLGGAGPYFVFKKDLTANTIWAVNAKNLKALYRDSFYLKSINWIIPKPIHLPLKACFQIRYHGLRVPGYLIKERSGYFKVQLKKKQFAIASGQWAVFYRGREVLGGGPIIDL